MGHTTSCSLSIVYYKIYFIYNYNHVLLFIYTCYSLCLCMRHSNHLEKAPPGREGGYIWGSGI